MAAAAVKEEPKSAPTSNEIEIAAIRTEYKNVVTGNSFLRVGDPVHGVLCHGKVIRMVLLPIGYVRVTVKQSNVKPADEIKSFYMSPPFYADEA